MKYRAYTDLGFDSSKINIGAVSDIAYLTYHAPTNIITVNLLLVDVYHDVPTFKIFKSFKKFSYNLKYDTDLVIESFIYSTKDDQGISENTIKLLT